MCSVCGRNVRHRDSRIDASYGCAGRFNQGARVAARSDDEVHGPVRILRIELIHRRRRRLAQAGVFGVANHADDLVLAGVLGRRAKGAPDGRLIREHLSRRRLVDDHDLRRLFGVDRAELPTGQQRNLHRREELRRHRHHVHVFLRATGQVHRRRAAAAGEQKHSRQRDRAHPRKTRELIAHLRHQQRRPIDVVAVQCGVQREHQQVVRIEADVDVSEIVDRPEKQAGTDEQHQRKRHLEHEQALAQQ